MIHTLQVSLSGYCILLILCGSLIFPYTGVAQISPVSDLQNLDYLNSDVVKAYAIIQATSSWKAILDSGATLHDVRIGIIDTGIDAHHPEFAGISGVGVVNLGATPLSSRKDSDIHGHGTKVAGIIGANNMSVESSPLYSPQMNGLLAGVLQNNQYQLEISTATGVHELLFEKAKDIFMQSRVLQLPVVNMSFGYVRRVSLSAEQQEIIGGQLGEGFFQTATGFLSQILQGSPGTLFVVSAGNEHMETVNLAPANLGLLSNVMTIGATTLEDARRESGNFGPHVSLSAPGENVYAPSLYTAPLDSTDYDAHFSGTSASAPMVTGVAGLLLAVNPALTPSALKTILTKEANTDPVTTDSDKPIGRRLNAYKAVCDSAVLNCPPSVSSITLRGTITLHPDYGTIPSGSTISLIALGEEGVSHITIAPIPPDGTYLFTPTPGTYLLHVNIFIPYCMEGEREVTLSAGEARVEDVELQECPVPV